MTDLAADFFFCYTPGTLGGPFAFYIIIALLDYCRSGHNACYVSYLSFRMVFNCTF